MDVGSPKVIISEVMLAVFFVGFAYGLSSLPLAVAAVTVFYFANRSVVNGFATAAWSYVRKRLR